MKTTRKQRDAIVINYITPGAIIPKFVLLELSSDCNELEDQRNAINAKLDAEMAVSAGLREERDILARRVNDAVDAECKAIAERDEAIARAERAESKLSDGMRMPDDLHPLLFEVAYKLGHSTNGYSSEEVGPSLCWELVRKSIKAVDERDQLRELVKELEEMRERNGQDRMRLLNECGALKSQIANATSAEGVGRALNATSDVSWLSPDSTIKKNLIRDLESAIKAALEVKP